MMNKTPKEYDAETKAYFETLPKMIQENIIMSAPDVNCKEDLERCVQNLLDNQN